MISGHVSLHLNINHPVILTLLVPPAIEHVRTISLEEFAAEFTKLVLMDYKKGTNYYYENHEQIGENSHFLLQMFTNTHRMDERPS